MTHTNTEAVSDEAEQALADRAWWRQAGEALGLELRGWTFRDSALFVDMDTGRSVDLPGSVAERLSRRAANSAGGVNGALENSVRRLRDILGEWARYHSDEVTSDIDAALYEADKLLSAFPAVEAEPVASVDHHAYRVAHVACPHFIADPCGSSKCAGCGKRRADHPKLTHPSSPVSAEVTEADGWQPIGTAPKDGTWFLGYRPDLEVQESVDVWHWDASADTDGAPGFWVNAADSNLDEYPTHWRPLGALLAALNGGRENG